MAEPFEEQLLIIMEDRIHPLKEDVLGKINPPLSAFEKLLDHHPVHSRWFNLEKYGFGACKLIRGNSSSFQLGILGAQGLLPMKMKDGRGSTDAYCVAKYGQKNVRTRTIIGTYNPKWNKQYT
ncbi:hypothetical protein REPUB_Repub04eG0108700 [Reevesia pubescens]